MFSAREIRITDFKNHQICQNRLKIRIKCDILLLDERIIQNALPKGAVTMKSYKNFTDAFAFIAAAVAFIYIFLAFKAFEPYENDAGETVKFYQEAATKPYIKLFFLFLITGVCGLAIRKLPALSLALSLLPLWNCLKYYYLDEIKKPMIFTVAAIIALAGNIIATVEFFGSKEIK